MTDKKKDEKEFDTSEYTFKTNEIIKTFYKLEKEKGVFTDDEIFERIAEKFRTYPSEIKRILKIP